MSNKTLWLGLITLIGFPILGYLISHGIDFSQLRTFLHLSSFHPIGMGYGIFLGYTYAFLAILLMKAPIFDLANKRIENVLLGLKINIISGLFISICAGIGEEYLFRVALQPKLGIILTSILFVAIHGYLNPFNWKMSLHGLVILPFTFLLAYGYEELGLGFAVCAHFAYDAVLFIHLVDSKSDA